MEDIKATKDKCFYFTAKEYCRFIRLPNGMLVGKSYKKLPRKMKKKFNSYFSYEVAIPSQI